jgi:Flagellar biosynthesis protein, FliO
MLSDAITFYHSAAAPAFSTTEDFASMALGSTVNTSLLMWQYFGLFLIYSLCLVALLSGFAVWLKKRPHLLQRLQKGRWFGAIGSSAPSEPEQFLGVEERLALEPNRTLYVVRYGQQRYLLATSAEGTDCLARLDGTAGEMSPQSAQQAKANAVLEGMNATMNPGRGHEEEEQEGLSSRLGNWAPAADVLLQGFRKRNAANALKQNGAPLPPFALGKPNR